MNTDLQEKMLNAWITINSQLKDSRITDTLTYNEAIVMKIVYGNYIADGVGKTWTQSLIKSTNFLKSLMNRTINSLCSQNYLKKQREGRNTYVYLVEERIPDFLSVHNNSLKIAKKIIDEIGEADAINFIRIGEKISKMSFDFNERN